MGTIWIREFTGGLDTRRLPETSSGGVLIKATDCHISRGGEIEQRPAFVDFGDVAGSVGLAYDPASLYVFGEAADPGGWPTGILYQQLVNPDAPSSALVRIRSWDLYAGKMYVAAEFDDGGVYHFYDGVNVEFWFDGKARAQFTVLAAAGAAGATAAHCTLEVLNLISFPAQIDNIFINATDLLASAITYNPGGFPTITDAMLLANIINIAINANSGTSGWTSVVSGALLTITSSTPGVGDNGVTINPVYDDTAVSLNGTMVVGGANAVVPAVTSVTIDAIESLSAPVPWAGSATATATALAAAMDANSGTTGFDVTSDGPTVYVAAQVAGVGENGKYVQIVSDPGMTFSTTSVATSGASDGDIQPGSFVRTVGKKMYSLGGPSLFFSGIGAPTQWNTTAVGAGFIDMSTESSGAEKLLAVARYQNLIAIFSETVIQLWYVDPDPALNKPSQTLNNTGTVCGLSVVQVGDTDLFYLDQTGIRSLQARSITNAASTTDIGIPVDSLVIAKLASLTTDERSKVIGTIEPRDGRLWMIMKDEIFVLSFFNGAKVSAWSTYTASTKADAESDAVVFDIDYAVIFKNRLYVRSSADRIYVFGGTGDTPVYDATVAKPWFPYLDANEPMREKEFASIDTVARGQWLVSAGLDPNQVDVDEEIARVLNTTYGVGTIPYPVSSNYISLRFQSEGVNPSGGPHKLAAAAIFYKGDANED